MKKSFLKCGLFVLLAFTTVVFNACDPENPDDGGSSGSTITQIVATNIQNAPSGIATVKIRAWVAASTSPEGGAYVDLVQSAYTNNGFTLKLPATVSDSYLNSANDEGIPTSVVVSDRNAKLFAFEEVDAFDREGKELGSFLLEASGNDIYHVVLWAYADRDVTVKGRAEKNTEDGRESSTYIYDMTFKKGWNTVYGIRNETSNSSYTLTFTSQKPANVNYQWRYYSSFGGDSYDSETTQKLRPTQIQGMLR